MTSNINSNIQDTSLGNNIILRKEAIKSKIESHTFDQLKEAEVEVGKFVPKLTSNRFDLAFKLFFLDTLENGSIESAKVIYKDHIRAFSLGTFIENGNSEKINFDAYYNTFISLFNDIRTNGFDSKKSLIPLAKDGSIKDGAHRAAISIFTRQPISAVKTCLSTNNYDYKFFKGRNVSQSTLDAVATTYVKFAKGVYIALVWPTAKGNDKELETLIPNIVYRKSVKLNPNGAHNLLSQIYYREKWVGTVENNFKGVKGKLVGAFENFNPIRVIAFQANSLEEVLDIKDKIRNVFNVGKSSVHITDTKDEALHTARVLFNDNSIHFLNHAKPNRYPATYNKIDKFKQYLKVNKIDPQDVLLDSGIILSLYGLRQCRDIDFFVDDNQKIKVKDKEIEIHDSELNYHQQDKLELIYNPINSFYFNDLKFLSFSQLHKMKNIRGETKDINDCKMMEALIENDTFKSNIIKLKQKSLYQIVKFEEKTLTFLRKNNLYNSVRTIYRIFK